MTPSNTNIDHAQPAPTAEQMKNQILFRRWFAVLFISLAVTAFYFGWFVTRNVREEAKQTDAQLRSVSWAIMSYSVANNTMPTSQEAFVNFISTHAQCLTAPRRAGEWPATQEAAQANGAPADIVAAVAGRIEVIWPPTGNLTPVLQVRGRPSGVGTIEQVNGWLQNWNHAAATSAP